MTKQTSTASTEKIAAFDQVNARSGHDWMKGEESSAEYFARARAEAVRPPHSSEADSTDSSAPPIPGMLRKIIRSLLKGSK